MKEGNKTEDGVKENGKERKGRGGKKKRKRDKRYLRTDFRRQV